MNSSVTATTYRSSLPAVLALAAALLIPGAATGDDASRLRALELYDQGSYAEALPLLEQLDAAGEAGGTDLYRLYFCLRHAGDPRATGTLQRARQALEAELPTALDLEVPFYLANTHRNFGRLSDAKRVAAQATGRLERGELPEPRNGIDRFRLAKLYDDQGRADEAARWYGEAIESFETEGGDAAAPYLAWALRYLADRTWEAGDYGAAAAHLARLTKGDDASAPDLDRLASALVRSGRYADARTAWQRVERLDPPNADRARYCWRLAGQASELGTLPETASDGRPWVELSREELEGTLEESAKVAREILAEASEAERIRKRQRRKMQARLDEARGRFVAAGLEHALRRFGIRETAFFGGYAPLVFHAKEWRLPEAAPAGEARRQR